MFQHPDQLIDLTASKKLPALLVFENHDFSQQTLKDSKYIDVEYN